MIAACVLPRLPSTCVAATVVDRAIGIVAGQGFSPPSPHTRLLDASDAALARGVRPGQRIADAQCSAPDLQVVVLAMGAVLQALHGVTEQLYRLAPACEPLLPDDRVCLPFVAVVVDLAGLPRSPSRLLADLARAAALAGHRAVLASSSSRTLSLAVARDMAARPSSWGRTSLVIDDRGPDRRAVRARLRARLAIEALEIDRDAVDDLRTAGLSTVQDLVSLLRGGLIERLGAAACRVRPLLVDADDADDIDDLVRPWHPPEVVGVARDLEHPVTHLEPLLFVVRPLVQDLLRRLDARGFRLLALEMSLHRRTAGAIELAVAFPAATSDIAVVVRVVQARLDRAFAQERMGADGVCGIALRATRTSAARARQLEAWAPTTSTTQQSSTSPSGGRLPAGDDAVLGLIAELGAELGGDRVGCLHPTRAPLPEHMTVLREPSGPTDDIDDDRVAGHTAPPRRRLRPVKTDPRTSAGRFAIGWPWPLTMLPVPAPLGVGEGIADERLFCRLEGTDGQGPYEREYRLVVFTDGRRALCVWDEETGERWLWGWFD